jgi:hypothetical protein
MMARLTMAVWPRIAWGGITQQALRLIAGHLFPIRDILRRTVERIEKGTYRPRRSSPRKPPTPTDRPPRPPKPPDTIEKKVGWMLPLAPQVRFFRGHVEALLKEPDTLALLAAAAPTLRRPIRSLCWSLKLKPPAVLARPRRPPRPEPAPPPKTARTPVPEPPAGRRSDRPRRHQAAGPPRSRKKA